MLKTKISPRVYVGAALVAVASFGLIVMTDQWPFWLLLLAAGVILAVSVVLAQFEYECQKCHGVYRIGVLGSLASKHGHDKSGSWAISRCPHCGAITKAKESRSYGKEKE